MAIVPSPRTWVVGDLVTAAMLNKDVRDADTFFARPPAASVVNSAALSIANATITYFTFNLESFDNDNIHDNVTNNSRLTCTAGGCWIIAPYANFTGNATGNQRSVFLRINGGGVFRQLDVRPNGAGVTQVCFAALYKFSLNDYIEMGVYQDSGGALNVSAECGFAWQGLG